MKTVTGEVIRGKRRGTQLGFPTANVLLREKAASGIYAGRVRADGKNYNAALYVGPEQKIVEAHLLDFFGTLYGKEIDITFVEKVRDHSDFTSEENLVTQISDDIEACVKILEPTS